MRDLKKQNPIRGTFPIQAVLFDLDGTLVDTEKTASLAIQRCFTQWRIQIQPEDASYVTGRTWESAFSYLFKRYDLPIPEADAKREMLASYREALESGLQIVPGSISAVEKLGREFPLGLVSGSGRDDILWILKKLEIYRYFQVILGAEDYAESKPQPDGYLKAIDLLQVAPKHCLVFEDSTAGIASARQAGLWVVAVTSTNHFQQNLSNAHFLVRDLTAVSPTWLRNLSFD